MYFFTRQTHLIVYHSEKTQKFASNGLLFPNNIRSYNNADFNAAFPIPSEERYKQLYNRIENNFPFLGHLPFSSIRKSGSRKATKVDTSTLIAHLLQEPPPTSEIKRKTKIWQ